jgi:hypothetical protein
MKPFAALFATHFASHFATNSTLFELFVDFTFEHFTFGFIFAPKWLVKKLNALVKLEFINFEVETWHSPNLS